MWKQQSQSQAALFQSKFIEECRPNLIMVSNVAAFFGFICGLLSDKNAVGSWQKFLSLL